MKSIRRLQVKIKKKKKYMPAFDTDISQQQRLFVFSFVLVALGVFVIIGYQSYFTDENTPSMAQDNNRTTVFPPTDPSAVIPPLPPSAEKPVATIMVSVSEASDDAPAEDNQ